MLHAVRSKCVQHHIHAMQLMQLIRPLGLKWQLLWLMNCISALEERLLHMREAHIARDNGRHQCASHRACPVSTCGV